MKMLGHSGARVGQPYNADRGFSCLIKLVSYRALFLCLPWCACNVEDLRSLAFQLVTVFKV